MSLASEQVPAAEQGVQRGGEASRSPDHHVSQQVDLSLQATGDAVSAVSAEGVPPSPVLRWTRRS